MNNSSNLPYVDIEMLKMQRKLAFMSEKLMKEGKARKNAEEVLERSESKFLLLSNNLVDVIWQMDLRLKFTYVSSSVYNMTGYSVDEWKGTYLYQHASMQEFFKMARQALIAIKNYKSFKFIEFSTKLLKKSGEEYPVEIVGRVLLNEKGLPTGIQGSTRDITKRKHLEVQLATHSESLEKLVRQRTFELEKKNRELEKFNELFVGREFRIKELRNEIAAFKKNSV